MRARAPGKLVISGAYSVLRGAPALVTAVDRYVVADDTRPSDFRTPEVSAALEILGVERPHPWFSAAELREGDRKLGLGSSAAICAASVALIFASSKPDESWNDREHLARSIYDLTLRAHRQAQGGGSGVDVAAACFGGTLAARIVDTEQGSRLRVSPSPLPDGLVVETWACPLAASTANFVKRVFSLEKSDPGVFTRLMNQQKEASEQALVATEMGDTHRFISALRDQYQHLKELGDRAEVPIVLPALRGLAEAISTDECFLPSGAGGGDVMLFVSTHPSSTAFRASAAAQDLHLIPLGINATGVQLLDEGSATPSSPLTSKPEGRF